MSAYSYLNNRQYGLKPKAGSRAYNYRLNLDHVINSFTLFRKDIDYFETKEGHAPYSCKFRRDSMCDLLAVCNQKGNIILYDTSEGASKVKSFSAHKGVISDTCWLPDKCQLISSSFVSTVLWDMCQFKSIASLRKPAWSLDVCYQQSAFVAIGSGDGSITIWDTRENNNKKPAICICHAHCRNYPAVNGRWKVDPKDNGHVSAVAFQDYNTLASGGLRDGAVKIWDLRRTYVSKPKKVPSPKYQMIYAEPGAARFGCSNLVFDSGYRTLYACSIGRKIFKFDCLFYDKIDAVYEGFLEDTDVVKIALSNDDQYLISSSNDEAAYIWKTSCPGFPLLELPTHDRCATSVSWSPYDITKLALTTNCGKDNFVEIWRSFNYLQKDRDSSLVDCVAEPFSAALTECLKDSNLPCQDTDQSSGTTFNRSQRKSPEVIQTTSKPSVQVITNSISSVTPNPSNVQLSSKVSISPKATKANINGCFENFLCEVQNKSSVSSQVLLPCSYTNMSNIMHQSAHQALEKSGSELEHVPCTSSSSCFKNKDNTETSINPESLTRTKSLGQTKRKLTPYSLRRSKRSEPGNSSTGLC